MSGRVLLMLAGLATGAAAQTADWSLVNSDGMDGQLLTPRARSVLAAPEFTWRHAQTEHFVLHFENQIFAAKVGRMVEFFRAYIAQDLGFATNAPAGRSHVFIFRNASDWSTFLRRYGAGAGEWSFSFVEGPILYLQQAGDIGTSADVLGHETTHLVIQQLLDGPLPLWINEGVAEWYGEFAYAAFKGVKKSRRTVFRNLSRRADPAAAMKARAYPADPRAVQDFYQVSKHLVGFLQLQKPDAFGPFLRDIAAGGSIETALARHYDFADLVAFEKSFWKFAR